LFFHSNWILTDCISKGNFQECLLPEALDDQLRLPTSPPHMACRGIARKGKRDNSGVWLLPRESPGTNLSLAIAKLG